jgi:hypothetical protein
MASQLIQQKPNCMIVRVTKTLVDGLLEMNVRNRNIRPAVVERYREAIRRGMYMLTNQGIGVTKSGVTFDGQHRLTAIQLEGYPPLDILLVVGLEEAAAAVVDQGTNRSPADYMHFLFNTRVSSLVTAALRTIMLMGEGDQEARRRFHAAAKIDPRDYAERLEKYGSSVNEVFAIDGAQRLPAAVLAALVLGHSKGYGDEVISFTKDIVSGEMLMKDSPQLALRRWLETSRGHGGATIMQQRFSKTESALSAFVEGRTMSKVYGKKAFSNRVTPLRTKGFVAEGATH